MLWLIPLLFALSLGGLAWVVLRALCEGAHSYASVHSEQTARQFEDLFLFIPPHRIAEAGWAASGAAFILIFLLTADSFASIRVVTLAGLLGAIAGAGALQTPRLLVSLLRRRRRLRFSVQLVETLVGMSNALKAGFSITQAFEAVVRDGESPIAEEFGAFLKETQLGVSFSAALDNLEIRVGSDDLTLVVLSIETARRTGGNLTEIFEKISATIRERMRIEKRIQTLTAQGRLQGIVVGAMPLIIAIALLIVDPDMMLPFLHSPTGYVVVLAVAALILCGALTIRKIVSIDV
jgi:tight adherence protein B